MPIWCSPSALASRIPVWAPARQPSVSNAHRSSATVCPRPIQTAVRRRSLTLCQEQNDMTLFLNRPSIPLAPWSLLQVDSAQQRRQFLRRDLSPALFTAIAEWHLVRAFFQSLTPHREAIA